MTRPAVRPVAVVMLLALSAPAFAEEKTRLAAPTAVVAAAWEKEAQQNAPSPTALKVLYGSYAVVSSADMLSTIVGRGRGAREINPLMRANYGQAAVTKAAFAAGTILAVKAIGKKSRKGAVITMLVVNAGTAAVVANNVRNARRLR